MVVVVAAAAVTPVVAAAGGKPDCKINRGAGSRASVAIKGFSSAQPAANRVADRAH